MENHKSSQQEEKKRKMMERYNNPSYVGIYDRRYHHLQFEKFRKLQAKFPKNKDYFRNYFLNNPYYAYFYAKDIDKKPHDNTRETACKDPEYKKLYQEQRDW